MEATRPDLDGVAVLDSNAAYRPVSAKAFLLPHVVSFDDARWAEARDESLSGDRSQHEGIDPLGAIWAADGILGFLPHDSPLPACVMYVTT